MPFRKLRKNLKELFLKARRAVPSNGNDNLPQVTETERASKASQVPSLETLPAELRCHILLMKRKRILCRSLEATLGNALADAYVVQMFSSSKLAPPHNPKAAADFLHSYNTILGQLLLNPLYKLLSIEEATSMVKFHFSIVQPLMRFFVTRASSILTETKGFQIGEISSRTEDEESLSRPEEMPSMREIEESLSRTTDTALICAFYRFQFCCNVYGFESLDSVSLNSRIATPRRVLKYFLVLLSASSEVSCLSYFSGKKLREIDHKITRNLRKRSARFDRRHGKFDGNTHNNSDRLLATPTFRGLELLHFVCSKIKDNDEPMVRCFCGFPGRGCHFNCCLRWDTLRELREAVSTESWAGWALPVLEQE
ncbi:hypothetical protein PENFLA_c016G00121 [Penicillium flavigenum]|uniref:Uncharacterized protein n=1 Tax=Penicillium flavigenum TaxID=254877 RepID=A0A1V6T4N2_9EURO|nr:hypothetical protein PENFLA_c016G00121 [Penicillium flavigenum]